MRFLDVFSVSGAVMKLYEFLTPLDVHRLADGSRDMGTFVRDPRLLALCGCSGGESDDESAYESDESDESEYGAHVPCLPRPQPAYDNRATRRAFCQAMALLSLQGVRERYVAHVSAIYEDEGDHFSLVSVHFLFLTAKRQLEEMDVDHAHSARWCHTLGIHWQKHVSDCSVCTCVEVCIEKKRNTRGKWFGRKQELERQISQLQREKESLDTALKYVDEWLEVCVPFVQKEPTVPLKPPFLRGF